MRWYFASPGLWYAGDMSTLIKRLGIVAKLKAELKELDQMLKDAQENNAELQDAKEQKQQMTRDFSVVKEKLFNEPGNAKLVEQVKQLKGELADEKEFLAQELAVYFSREGKSEITLPDGKVVRFKLAATVTEYAE